jgi:hypothetical protein
MKTNTRYNLLKLIEKHVMARPVDLARSLKITPQALHRHLKRLVVEGTLGVVGAPPFTQYRLAGPDFEAAFSWLKGGPLPASTPSYCATRDVMEGRLPQLAQWVRKGLPEAQLPLVIATAAEVANNAFDHNLGKWRDVPGCWLEAQVMGKELWVCVADRGQGVRQSLSTVLSLPDDQTALETVFDRIISGRSPERRGNGLKFVKKVITEGPGRGLAAASGSGQVSFGELGPSCHRVVARHFGHVDGTLGVMIWKLE